MLVVVAVAIALLPPLWNIDTKADIYGIVELNVSTVAIILYALGVAAGTLQTIGKANKADTPQ